MIDKNIELLEPRYDDETGKQFAFPLKMCVSHTQHEVLIIIKIVIENFEMVFCFFGKSFTAAAVIRVCYVPFIP